MTRVARWAIPAAAVALPLGIILPAVAQRAAERSQPDVNNAKQMVTLIEQGQLNLADATKLAEKHIKGTALAVDAGIQQRGMEKNPAEPKPGDPGDEASYSIRVVYNITCFAEDKVQQVKVDALTKEVIEKEGEQKQQEKTPPQP